MSQYIELHPSHPDPRMLAVVVDSLKSGAVIAYPTDSGYALGCTMEQQKPLDRIRQLRDLDKTHNFTLICQDLAEVSRFAKVDNTAYRLMKKCVPGGYTFILKAGKAIPKSLMPSGKTTIGVRVPDHPTPLSLSAQLNEPLVSTTLILPGQDLPLIYPEDIADAIGDQIDVMVDVGYCDFEPTTVVDLSDSVPQILRHGSGDSQFFE